MQARQQMIVVGRSSLELELVILLVSKNGQEEFTEVNVTPQELFSARVNF
jgi:hypothetical protein